MASLVRLKVTTNQSKTKEAEMKSSTKLASREEESARATDSVELALTNNWAKIKQALPFNLEASAYLHKAHRRSRGLQRAEDVLRLALMYALKGWSLRLLGAWALLQGLGCVSDVAILKRLRNCHTWLAALVGAILLERNQELSRHTAVRVRLQDATVITKPGSQGTDWRIHLSLDLEHGCLDGIEVTDGYGGETFMRFEPQPGEIRVGDRGYANPKGLASLLTTGTGFVVRTNWHNLRLYTLENEVFDLIAWLPSLTSPQECQVDLATDQGAFRLRLLAWGLPPDVAAQARRRSRKNNQRRGRQVSEGSLTAAGFVILLTNLPASEWPLPQVFALYRLRWQVELGIKRLKSLLHVDQLRARDPQMAKTYLLANLLAALVLDGLVRQMYLHQPEWFISLERPVSFWRLFDCCAEVIRQTITGILDWDNLCSLLPQMQRYFCDSPRSRPQHLAYARAFLEHLNASFSFFSC
jgi:hypothetical protein